MLYPVAIVGGGIAGLTVARRLHQAGIGFILAEARDRLGGRILTVSHGLSPHGEFDLGATWYWPDMQPTFAALVAELGLASFPQHNHGDVIFERSHQERSQRFPGFGQSPESMRLAGGMGAMALALAATLPSGAIHLNTRVIEIAQDSDGLRLTLSGPTGQSEIQAAQVVLALPPRLVGKLIAFLPPVDNQTAWLWRATPTWMAPHAKFLAFYDAPFWREQGLSGSAQSMLGPLMEIHDASTVNGDAALFGFIGVTADQRASIGREVLVGACVEQLGRLFGPKGRKPYATRFKDWANDPFTATSDDRMSAEHPALPSGPWIGEPWSQRIFFAGSETSQSQPGYLSGAVAAAERCVLELKRSLPRDRSMISGGSPTP